jgi:hypothetical protein
MTPNRKKNGRIAKVVGDAKNCCIYFFCVHLQFCGTSPAAPNCNLPFEFPVDFLVCNDPQLAALDDEIDDLHNQASRMQISHPPPTSQNLRRSIQDQCNLPLLIDVPEALKARTCVVAAYIGQLKKSAALTHPIKTRLRSKPAQINSASAYFTILRYRASANEAQEDLARLKEDFPFEEFALYPPRNDTNRWAIVLSSYVDQQIATRSGQLSVVLGISTKPEIFRIPEAMRATFDWLPTTASTPSESAVQSDSAPQSSDLNVRVAVWRRYAELCTLQKTIWKSHAPTSDLFPTKDDNSPSPNAGPCDDGDMGLFNGMLCAAGESQGCSGVANSEGSTHQWWRSPAIRAHGVDSADQPNLNSDQLLGLLLYVLQENKRDEFREWLEWINSNGSPTRLCSIVTDKCFFRPTDCPLITLTAYALEVQNAVLVLCTPPLIFGISSPQTYLPRFNDAVNAYQAALAAYKALQDQVAALQKILNISGVPNDPVPPIPSMQEFTAQLQKVNDHFQKLVNLLQPPDPASFAMSYVSASALVTANALVAGAGQDAPGAAQARHLAATAIFLLKKFRIPDPALSVAGAKLADQQRDNPYFEFLARGPNQRMRELVMNECIYDPTANQPKFQWSWERAVSADAAKQTMLWDCIFIADLLQNGLIGMKAKVPGDPASLIPSISAELQDLKEAAGEMEQVIKTVLDAKPLVDDLSNALKQQLKYLGQLAQAAAKGSLPTINPDGSVSVPVAPLGTPGSPTATVDPKKGNITVSGFGHGVCIGFHC